MAAMRVTSDVRDVLEPLTQAQPEPETLRADVDDSPDEGAAETDADQAPDPRRVAPPRQISFFRDDGRKLRKDDAKALLSPDAFVKGRSARLSRGFDARDFVKEGELLPENDLLDLFARVRATPLAEAECALLLASFASHCRVRSYEVKRIEDSTRYELNTNLLFIQKTPAGPMPETDAVLVVDEQLTGDRIEYPKGDVVAYDALRAKMLGEAEAACAVVRSTYGTCFLNHVALSNSVYDDRASLRRTVRMQATLPLDLSGSGN